MITPEQLAKIEMDYAAGGYNHVPAVGELLGVIDELRKASVIVPPPAPVITGVQVRTTITKLFTAVKA